MTLVRRCDMMFIGVEDIEIDMEMQKVVVKGYGLEERKVLKAIKRAGKAAEPWPYPGYSSHFASFYKYPAHIANQYYYDRNETAGHNLHTFFHTPSVYSVAIASDEAVASLFSDDNPHACAIIMIDDKTKQKAIEGAADIYGVDSIAADLKDQKLTVVGDMDAVALVKKLVKVVGIVDIESVGPTAPPEPQPVPEKKNV
ncbi:heavy metal-associated isoprenylated plant protein 31 isoform X1 [Tanacetum coccineum]